MALPEFKCEWFINMREFRHAYGAFKYLHKYLRGNAGKPDCKIFSWIFVASDEEQDACMHSFWRRRRQDHRQLTTSFNFQIYGTHQTCGACWIFETWSTIQMISSRKEIGDNGLDGCTGCWTGSMIRAKLSSASRSEHDVQGIAEGKQDESTCDIEFDVRNPEYIISHI